MRRPVRHQLIAASLLVGALTYLGLTAAGSGWVYYVDVDQYTAETASLGRRARVFGTVGDADLRLSRADLTASFDLLGANSRVRVEYRGAVPELFQAGRHVVVEGAMGPDGTFIADVLLTKCSSKYEGRARADVGAAELLK